MRCCLSLTRNSTYTMELSLLKGGDGFFNKILNGFLKSRHKAPYPPAPSDFIQSVVNETVSESSHNEDHSPLLPSPRHKDLGLSNCRSEDASCSEVDQDPEFPIPNERFRFGIIPAVPLELEIL